MTCYAQLNTVPDTILFVVVLVEKSQGHIPQDHLLLNNFASCAHAITTPEKLTNDSVR